MRQQRDRKETPRSPGRQDPRKAMRAAGILPVGKALQFVGERGLPLTWRHVMNGNRDIVFKQYGCTDAGTGPQLGGSCPRLAEPGHGSWYYAVQVTTVGGRK